MDEHWRRTFSSWAKQPAYRRLVGETRDEIDRELISAARPIVSFSGGKDSTVLTHLVLQADPGVTVLHWDYGPYFVPRPIHDAIVANAYRLGARSLRVETSPAYERLGRQARNVLGRHMVGWLLPRLAREGYDLSFVGLRAEESAKRRRRLVSGRSLGPLREAWPLARWRWLDVWAYIVEHDLPYLAQLYDPAAAVVGWEHARWTTLHDPEFAHVAAASDGVLHWRWRHAGELARLGRWGWLVGPHEPVWCDAFKGWGIAPVGQTCADARHRWHPGDRARSDEAAHHAGDRSMSLSTADRAADRRKP